MPNTAMLKAKGLYTFQNFLSFIPEGSLLDATNVVIDRDGIIEPRRGIKQYGTFGTSGDIAKQLLTYKTRVLVHYGSTLAYDNGSGTFANFSGTYPEVDAGLRIKGVEFNGNFYFTTSTGIKKIASNSTTLSTADESDAGGINALDGIGTVDYTSPGFLTGLSKVAYRIVWGTYDVNQNLILGSPSSRIVVTNYDTNSGNVNLTFDVPAGITTDYFYQIYRTEVSTAASLALLDAVDPGDEMKLIIQDNYVSGSSITLSDITPESFQQGGAFLYTNPISGEGILQANERPPVAKDIAVFKNSVFYANTRTRHSLALSLLGVGGFSHGDITNVTATNPAVITSAAHGLITGDRIAIVGTGAAAIDTTHIITRIDANNFSVPANGTGAAAATGTWFGSYLNIFNGTTTNRYFFVGRKEVTPITFDTQANTTDGSYFHIYAANNTVHYAVWFDKTGTTTPPVVSGAVLIRVNISAVGAGTNVSPTVRSSILAVTNDFVTIAQTSGTVLTFTPANTGPTTNASAGAVPPGGTFAIGTIIQGFGEDNTNNYVRLSGFASAGQAIDDTARSLVRIINQNASEVIYGYYLSGPDDVPGLMEFERRTVVNTAFTITANNATVGALFNPDLTTAASSANEVFPNRIYFSKFQQPEAVPIVNFLDVGPKDQAILRIVPLRDSLFIFKQDAIYRLTGDISPNFSIILFDNSVHLIAPDTAAVLNNQIYCLTDGGIATVTETGVGIISRPIENFFNRVATDNFPAFSTASFGIGYETERSYFVWTVTNMTDTYATQCFRYNTFTQSWTRWDKAQTCIVLNSFNNRLHFGSPTTDIVEVERKSLTRTDYADREISLQIPSDAVIDSTTLEVSSAEELVEGDALVQTQYVTMNTFNSLLLKLDLDPRVGLLPGTFDTNYAATLTMVAGDNITNQMTSLVTKLLGDPGTKGTQTFAPADVNTGTETITLASNALFNTQVVRFTSTGTLPAGLSTGTTYFIVGATANTFQVSATSGGSPINLTSQGTGVHTVEYYVFSGSSTFSVIQTEYNRMITAMNADTKLKFANYQSSSGTVNFELTIESVDKNANQITSNFITTFMVGPITAFKGIQSSVVWAPDTGGDPSLLKHYREATMLFETSAFRSGTIGYNTDLSPSFETIDFSMDGSGVWGGFVWTDATWGGGGTSVPFRTYIPRQKQRCRYIRCKLVHHDAFYKYSVLGISYAFEVSSDRAYRGRA